ncbi:MAG: hypothetical protein AUK47_24050 [Deltaproteobacteria bacterium CG2_30_63_29]|nr:MAG: hypothetical protein AUK47_24050 [Deltaproteobacteria bacterium CG2_30_63_29]PJB35920.1 MAG: hypothetical protein CO108_24640 [Deltaproteobacteria bacterium CG_4_9_14_3_um_filter_63_12]
MSTELLNHYLAGSLGSRTLLGTELSRSESAASLRAMAPCGATQLSPPDVGRDKAVTVRLGLPSDRNAMAELASNSKPSTPSTRLGDLALGLRHSLVAERDGALLAFVLFFIHRRLAWIDELRVSRHGDWRQTTGILLGSLQNHLRVVGVHEITF